MLLWRKFPAAPTLAFLARRALLTPLLGTFACSEAGPDSGPNLISPGDPSTDGVASASSGVPGGAVTLPSETNGDSTPPDEPTTGTQASSEVIPAGPTSSTPTEALTPTPSSGPEPAVAPNVTPTQPSTVTPTRPSTPAAVDCAAIASNSSWELCDSSNDQCTAVFTDGAGCAALCGAAGLICAEVWEDAEDACAPDTERAALDCAQASGHESDYCVCRGPSSDSSPAPQPSTEPEPTNATATEPDPSTMEPPAPPSSEPEITTEPEPTEPDATTEAEDTPPPESPDIGPRACGCEQPAGEAQALVGATIVVEAGQVFDGACQIYRADPAALGDGNQDEGQKPVFRVNDGGSLRNVVLGASAADGIHVYGDVTLENVHWLDIGEDALTVKESGTVTLDCGSAADGSDKVFQVNAAADVYISNFTARNAGKFMRQNGGTDFTVSVTIDHCDISDMKEVIFRTDSGSSHATVRNTRYSRLGDGLFMFGDRVENGNSAQSTVENNQEY